MGIAKYIDVAFPGLRNKIQGTQPLSSIPVQDKGDAGMRLMGGKPPWHEETKANEPAYGTYDHNSPAKPL